MAKALEVTLDLSQVQGLADALGKVDPAAINAGARQVVNAVVDDAYETIRPRMIRTINLTDTYLKDKERMKVHHAKDSTGNNINAQIVASGSKSLMTRLFHYGAFMLHQEVKHPHRSKGDFSHQRNLSAGTKGAGAMVEVTRGAPKVVKGGFFMPLKGTNGKVGLFKRKAGQKKYKHLYAPSVYQLFKAYADLKFTQGVESELDEKLTLMVGKIIDESLK
jgi:hypothetical protein